MANPVRICSNGLPEEGSRCGPDTVIVADPLQLMLLKHDIDAWNNWRNRNPAVRVDLRGADLSQADLRLADLRDADLRDATLILANLAGADLRGADLRDANMVGAKMIGVDIKGTDLRGTDIRTAEDLTQEQLRQTRGDEDTVLPEPMVRPDSWCD